MHAWGCRLDDPITWADPTFIVVGSSSIIGSGACATSGRALAGATYSEVSRTGVCQSCCAATQRVRHSSDSSGAASGVPVSVVCRIIVHVSGG